MISRVLILIILVTGYSLYGQTDSIKAKLDSIKARIDPIKTYTTAELKGEAPKIDGLGNDPAWEQVTWGGGGFRQKMPDAGAVASVETYFKVLYDAKNLYILFRCLDPEPSKIVSRMSRRDGFEGDWVEVNIDSYADKRTAFSFTSSVSGVKGDEYVSNNGEVWDASWDPIWYLKTSINSEGWMAELRIPLSQLRFPDKPEHVWGFQVQRLLFRKQEMSNWQFIPPTSNGWVHRFPELHGIKGIRPQKQLEIQPYIVAKTETFQKEENNPFATGASSSVDVGLDAKIGITSDITLDLTVNPDFGQVEADPSRVNLTAFELFFQERRPFFIEGSHTLNFPISDMSSDNLFYSRRIGRRPQGEPDIVGPNVFSTSKSRTTILGAAKLTGKNKKGFSWGILESVTNPEKATLDSLGERSYQTIEPLTNYFVARAQQDIHKGNTLIGAMFTATNRKIVDQRLTWLPDNAYSGGVDFTHNWHERKYYFAGKVFMSHISGSAESMITSQRASERFFQRPDNNHAEVDSTLKSLTGSGGQFVIGKRSGRITFDLGGSWLSPQLELNDVGFLLQTDKINQWSWVQYRIPNPKGIARSQRYGVYENLGMDFDGRTTSRTYSTDAFVELKNFWFMAGGITLSGQSISNADLRGGPAIQYPGSSSYWFYLSTDRRKKLQVGVGPSWFVGDNDYLRTNDLDLEFTYRPSNALNFSVNPSFSHSRNHLQYVATGSVDGEDRYVLGEIEQATFRVSLRMTYMLTPNLSIQYWGQPFGTAGTYSNFKQVTDSRAAEYGNRFALLAPSQINPIGDSYHVDQYNRGASDYSFDKPDFNFGQFRSNMVMRWEYIPGSTLFLVWTQEMNGAFYDRKGSEWDRYSFDFNTQAHNIFLIKYTYRFVL
ncbi:MAG: carbohydrate binding family 9 domain-containing protein [Cyclobacteriaceae bacterium]|nr:carbohydrate binding family 9 domain-containing protein [Cyclobacteriaceae bacterium]